MWASMWVDRNVSKNVSKCVSMVKALAPREVWVDKNDPENWVESHADSARAQDGDDPGKEDPLEHADVYLWRNESQSQSWRSWSSPSRSRRQRSRCPPSPWQCLPQPRPSPKTLRKHSTIQTERRRTWSTFCGQKKWPGIGLLTLGCPPGCRAWGQSSTRWQQRSPTTESSA